MINVDTNFTIEQGSTFERVFAIKKPIITSSGNTTTGSAIISGLQWTGGLEVGMSVVGIGIPVGATISSITDLTSFVISANATADGTAIELTMTSGGYFDLSTLDFRGQLRDTVSSIDVGAEMTFVKNLSDNTVKMKMSSITTSQLDMDDYDYDIEMYSANDLYVIKVLRGIMTIIKEVTR